MVDAVTPVFVKIDEYKEVLDIIDVVKGKLAEAKETIEEIGQLKAKEDRELAAWSRNLAVVEQKILAVDKTVFGKR